MHEMRDRFFGEPWPSDICDEGQQDETPVGTPCFLCDEGIASGDRGWWAIVVARAGPSWEPVHLECQVRSVSGGIEHLTAGPHKVGECYHDTTLSYRDSALAAFAYLRSQRVIEGDRPGPHPDENL